MSRGTPAEAELYQVRTYEFALHFQGGGARDRDVTSRNPSRTASYVMLKVVKSFKLFNEEQVQSVISADGPTQGCCRSVLQMHIYAREVIGIKLGRPAFQILRASRRS